VKPMDDFYFNKDGKLTTVIDTDKPDRIFQADAKDEVFTEKILWKLRVKWESKYKNLKIN